VRPDEAIHELSRHTETLNKFEPNVESLVQAARQVAGNVRQVAARAGHSVGIRVLEKRNGVRITVTGPQAHRYRAMINEQLERSRPETADDIRAQITRKIR
jgi:hypothetical protein